MTEQPIPRSILTLAALAGVSPSVYKPIIEAERLLAGYDAEQRRQILAIHHETGWPLKAAIERWQREQAQTGCGILADYLDADEFRRIPFAPTHRLHLDAFDAERFAALSEDARRSLVRAAVQVAMAEGWSSPAAVLPALLGVLDYGGPP